MLASVGPPPPVTPDEFDQYLDDLETRLERLRSLYEQYFMGMERIEPSVARKDVDRRFWVLRREKVRNTARRFKLQTLVQRYNTLQQYWHRTCREIEQGTYRRHKLKAERAFATRAPEAPTQTSAPPPDPSDVVERSRQATRSAEEDLRALLASDFDPAAEVDAALDAIFNLGPAPSSPAPVPRPVTGPPTGSPSTGLGTARTSTAPRPPTSAPRPPSPAPRTPGLTPRTAPPSAVPRAPEPRLRPPTAPPRPASTAPRPDVPAGSPSRGPAPPSRAPAQQSRGPAPPSRGPVPPPRTPAPPPRPLGPPSRGPTPPPAAARPRPAPARADAGSLSDARIRELHRRYLAARTGAAPPMSLDKLAQSLRATEQKLRQQHRGRRIDFDIVVRDGKPVIKPKLT